MSLNQATFGFRSILFLALGVTIALIFFFGNKFYKTKNGDLKSKYRVQTGVCFLVLAGLVALAFITSIEYDRTLLSIFFK
ncbi:MAG: hypothetical protein WCO06_04995 [Candidatus Roizmanbacteria bacterium]